MINVSHTLVWLSFICCVLPLLGQYVPPNPCPNYFQYLSNGGTFIGRLTLPVQLGQTTVQVRFSQREPIPSDNHGSKLSLYYDQDTTVANIQNNQLTHYRVDFPHPNIPPKLTEISLNSQPICRGSRYPPPRSNIELIHYLEASATALSQDYNAFPIYGDPRMQNTSPPSLETTKRVDPPAPRGYYYRTTPRVVPTTALPQTRINPNSVAQPMPSVSANAGTCGQEGGESLGFRPFIAGGSVLNRGQFPWLVAMYQKVPSGTTFRCGGSLISPRTVITAAHCFKELNLSERDVLLYLGRYNLNNHTETGYQVRDISSVIINPDYNSEQYPDADIAILHLSAPVTYTAYIQPVCLWTEPDDHNLLQGLSAVVAGWGSDNNGNVVSALPKMVTANIVDVNLCKSASNVFKKLTSPRTICAGNLDGTGPCIGDSGGGLLLNRDGRWVLRGVVSTGTTFQFQCNLRLYVVYCDLAKHKNWILENL